VNGKLPLSLTDGHLPANRLDNIDMSKVPTGLLYYDRVQDDYLGINDRFARTISAYENDVNTSGVWTNKFMSNTNLHLNYYTPASILLMNVA
jgi:hypothetical protein